MTTQELLMLAPVAWQKTVEAMTSEEQANLVDELSFIAQKAAFLCEYIDQIRYNSGHESAVKEGNKALVGTRKALGYTFPKRNTFSI